MLLIILSTFMSQENQDEYMRVHLTQNTISMLTYWFSIIVIDIWEKLLQSSPADMFCIHGDVIKWKHFPHYWPPHKGQWRGVLISPIMAPLSIQPGLQWLAKELHNYLIMKLNSHIWFSLSFCPRHHILHFQYRQYRLYTTHNNDISELMKLSDY